MLAVVKWFAAFFVTVTILSAGLYGILIIPTGTSQYSGKPINLIDIEIESLNSGIKSVLSQLLGIGDTKKEKYKRRD